MLLQSHLSHKPQRTAIILKVFRKHHLLYALRWQRTLETWKSLSADTEENCFDWYFVLAEQGYLVLDHPVVEELLKHLSHVRSERGHCCGVRDGADLAISCQPKAFNGKPLSWLWSC